MTPLWAGWNSVRCENRDYVQKVWCLPQINESPTSHAVVAETMKRSLKVAEEAGRQTIPVTYDLAIVRIALQIQGEESPKYDNLFVTLGAFHVELAFFKAIGKVIAEFGGPYVLQESDVLAKGSLQSFITGKNYKPCKRLHETLSLSLEILHFERFVSIQDDKDGLVTNLRKENPEWLNNGVQLTPEVEEILKRYFVFCGKTEDGVHGKTAQFWIHYIKLIHIYHESCRSVRQVISIYLLHLYQNLLTSFLL